MKNLYISYICRDIHISWLTMYTKNGKHKGRGGKWKGKIKKVQLTYIL